MKRKFELSRKQLTNFFLTFVVGEATMLEVFTIKNLKSSFFFSVERFRKELAGEAEF